MRRHRCVHARSRSPRLRRTARAPPSKRHGRARSTAWLGLPRRHVAMVESPPPARRRRRIESDPARDPCGQLPSREPLRVPSPALRSFDGRSEELCASLRRAKPKREPREALPSRAIQGKWRLSSPLRPPRTPVYPKPPWCPQAKAARLQGPVPVRGPAPARGALRAPRAGSAPSSPPHGVRAESWL